MRKVRVLAALSVFLLLLWGCGGENQEACGDCAGGIETSVPAEGAAAAAAPANGQTPAESTRLTATSLILTVNGDPVHWPEFHFWLNYIGKYYKNTLGIEKITDWRLQQNGMDLKDFFLSTAVGYACKDRAIEAKAKELGIQLSEKDLSEMAEKRASNIRIYGSVSEYLRVVAAMYMSEEVFNFLTKIDYLGDDLFEHFYGENGEKFTDREVLHYIEEGGLTCVRYIFRSNLDAGGNPLAAEKQAENTRLLTDLRERLDASDDPPALFTELMKIWGEDETMAKFPGGRLLAPVSRGAAFEAACSGLKENRYSGIVTTEAGSYIILRMPVFPAMTADSAGNTLQYRAAYERFKKQVETWSEEMTVVYEDAYYKVNVEALL